MIVTTNKDILESQWNIKNTDIDSVEQIDWDYSRTPCFEDIVYWEPIYYCPGAIGVYAALQPYVEFYIIVHNLYCDQTQTYETFFGNSAGQDIFKRLQSLGVTLDQQYTWSNLLTPSK